jgi:predicted RNase H-like nuclease (RuvC/YqgF family)
LKGSPNKCIGVIAQELEEIFPSLISEEGEREKYKSVKYSCMNIMLVKALQEQQVLINDMSSNISTLKDEVATLKQGINSLTARLEALEASAN